MGTENKIEFGNGTVYFNGVECPVGTFEMEAPAVEPIDMPYLNKIINENIEFTGTCKVSFRGLVLLMGFWPAVRRTVRGWLQKIKDLWCKLRTPIDDE